MSSSHALRTPLCDLLGCQYPVIQTAMGWVAGSSLVAATTNAGGFGFLAGATMGPRPIGRETESTGMDTSATTHCTVMVLQRSIWQ